MRGYLRAAILLLTRFALFVRETRIHLRESGSGYRRQQDYDQAPGESVVSGRQSSQFAVFRTGPSISCTRSIREMRRSARYAYETRTRIPQRAPPFDDSSSISVRTDSSRSCFSKTASLPSRDALGVCYGYKISCEDAVQSAQ